MLENIYQTNSKFEFLQNKRSFLYRFPLTSELRIIQWRHFDHH